jgi:hypothetical protein
MLALSAAASAAQPKPGEYSYSDTYAQGHAIVRIDFAVMAGAPLKVKQFTWTDFTCGELTVSKALRVSKKGKFSYSGPAKTAGTAIKQITVAGQFTSKSKASVTVSSVDCGDAGPAIVKKDS